MGTLTMALAAVLLAGNATEKVSAEQVEQRLDLRGEWEGTWRHPAGCLEPVEIRTRDGERCIEGGGFYATSVPLSQITDKGSGRCRLQGSRLGTYHQQSGRVVIRFSPAGKGYPTASHDSNEQDIVTLRRVK
jgi:hypothetical protein